MTHHRDSLLADVDQLQNNLRVNRIMRNKMLEAHQMTENDMRSNIKQNSAVRDAAISDVKELEQDVGACHVGVLLSFDVCFTRAHTPCAAAPPFPLAQTTAGP